MKGVTPSMKKSHEYDSPVLSKLVSVVTVVAICICSLCCIITASKVSSIATGSVATGNASGGSTGDQGSSGGSTGDQGSATPAPDANAGDQGSSGDSNEAGNQGGEAEVPNGPSKEEVLKKYTEVMDNLKSNVAQYEKKEFQMLSDDRDLGTIGNAVLTIAEGLMTSEEEAELQVRDDYQQIPVVHNTKGCILTDPNAIKTATMTEEGGKTTIVIVLNDEKGSLPAAENATSHTSTVGSMFNPIDQAGIDDIISKFAKIPGISINNFGLTYKDCTATVVFDTATGKVESINQIMNVYIEVDAKLFVAGLTGYATLINTMNIGNVQYK